eukprot:463599_1
MGCISSTQQELRPDNVNIDVPTPTTHQSDSIDITSLHDWDTNDLISYIDSIENGQFQNYQYDTFKNGLISLGLNGKTMKHYIYNPNILKDLGLKNDNDIILIQTKMVELYSNYQFINQNNDTTNNNKIDDDFFPSEWTFPRSDTEKIKNNYYINQKLLIRSNTMQQIPSIVIYIENNWIITEYKTKVPNTDNNNTYDNIEKLHVIKDMNRISKFNINNISNDEIKSEYQNDDDMFDEKTDYYGMSFISQSNNSISNNIPNCYIDPITYEIMNSPITSKISGRTYDKKMILKHINNYGTDPFNQKPMNETDLYENKNLKRAINRWLKNNPNANCAI